MKSLTNKETLLRKHRFPNVSLFICTGNICCRKMNKCCLPRKWSIVAEKFYAMFPQQCFLVYRDLKVKNFGKSGMKISNIHMCLKKCTMFQLHKLKRTRPIFPQYSPGPMAEMQIKFHSWQAKIIFKCKWSGR